MMGMGEPLNNFGPVVDAMSIMLDDHAYGLSRRRVTLSTSGVVPQIRKLKDALPVALAVSLHAPNDAIRSRIMPVNDTYPIATLLDACREYLEVAPRDFITFEYVMLKGVNDAPDHARELAKLLEAVPSKVNLIPFNPFPDSGFEGVRHGTRASLPEDPHRRGLHRDGAQDARRRHRRGVRPARRPGREPHEAQGRPFPFSTAEVLMRISLVARAVVATAAVAALAGCVSQSNTQSHPVTESGAPASAHRRAEVHTSLAGEYFSRGNFNVALSETKLAVKDDPNYVQAYNMQGLVYMELREDVAAREAFDRALSLDPNNAEVLNNFGWFLCTRNDTTRAMTMLKSAASDPLYPTREKAYLSTGLCLRRMHQDARRRSEWLRRAVPMRPGHDRRALQPRRGRLRAQDYKDAETYIARYMRLVAEPAPRGPRDRREGRARRWATPPPSRATCSSCAAAIPDAPQTRELTEKH